MMSNSTAKMFKGVNLPSFVELSATSQPNLQKLYKSLTKDDSVVRCSE